MFVIYIRYNTTTLDYAMFRHIFYTFEVRFNIYFYFIRKIIVITSSFVFTLLNSHISIFSNARYKFQYMDSRIAKQRSHIIYFFVYQLTY